MSEDTTALREARGVIEMDTTDHPVMRLAVYLPITSPFTVGEAVEVRAALAATQPKGVSAEPGHLTDYQRGYIDGFDAPANVKARAATQPSPEPLDVDRLARALQSGVAWMDVLFPDEWPYVAAKVAAEYARLAAEKANG